MGESSPAAFEESHCEVPACSEQQRSFSDFLGSVEKELLSDARSSLTAPLSQSIFFQFTITKLWGSIVSGPSGSQSYGQLSMAAALSDRATETRQDYTYKWEQRRWCVSPRLWTRDRHEDDEDCSIAMDCRPKSMSLSVPMPMGPSVDLTNFMHVLNAWATTATKCLAGSVAGLPLLQLTTAFRNVASGGTFSGMMPLKLNGFDFSSSFLSEEGKVLETQLSTHVGLFSLTSAVMFIGSIRGLNKHSTAREGNFLGMLATALGILSVLASPGFHDAHLRFFATFLLAGAAGYGVAVNVKMEDMPQLVAGFHSFVGLAAVFAGFASYFNPSPFLLMKALETAIGTAIGSLTFTGSVVAAGKLHEWIPGKPIILDNRWLLNGLGVASSALLTALFASPSFYLSPAGTAILLTNTAIWGLLGINMVLPIGGADMPVVVSLLNAFSGLATSAAGFMLSNDLLTITGALVASSGTLLSDIMCRGINRSMYKVLLGGFGTDGSSVSSAVAAGGRANVSEVSPLGFVGMLFGAKRVVIVPGYGLAVARCQQRLGEIVSVLRRHNVVVHFAIHPVAGRMPGHMNVLLAEADIPYDIVREMEDINEEIANYDVAIVVGANDIVNPATQDDPASPIYGMPAIEIWKCKACVVMKRSMGTGYSGVDNPLFYLPNVKMLFGDAKTTMETISTLLESSQNQITGLGSASGSSDTTHGRGNEVAEQSEQFPEATKVLGVLRERNVGERRVSVVPATVLKFRRQGFSILLEAGAGTNAGFLDEDYTRLGGVQVAESAQEVLKQADVILKVTEPMLDEVQVLHAPQTMVGFWNMFGSKDLLDAISQSSASFVNLALVPRVSRAQKLDALTSMANIAGYRAVLDAFNRLPRFSRSSATAAGAVAPAKVFIIGAGVAGLSAIATAHSLGCKVFANDVREAAREQVQSMGAEFIPVDAEGISGEGAGGYASEMGDSFMQAQLATYARVIPDMDVIITTAMIPNRPAPQVITEAMVASMRTGSVIVDLAAQTGGNCVYTKMDKVVMAPNGVTVIGETNYPSTMPAQASELISSNFLALLETLGGARDFGGEHWDDAIIKPAVIAHEGRLTWNPNPPRAPVSTSPPREADSPGGGFGGATPVSPPSAPAEADALIKWLEEHKEELALGVGGAVILGLGLVADIPEAEITHLGYFVLSCLIGNFTVAGVTPALHTPLISVTNAISGIIVVGGMLQLSGPLLSARVACALAAVFLSSVNIVGGFAVTQRMLEMFKEDAKARSVR